VAATNAATPEKPSSPAPAPETGTASAPEPAAAPEPKSAATAATVNSGTGVIAAGPGYSIKSARTDATARSNGFAPADSVASSLAVERRDEPIVCQGARFLRIDSRNLEFAGDAISAEDGCEMHITNSRRARRERTYREQLNRRSIGLHPGIRRGAGIRGSLQVPRLKPRTHARDAARSGR